MDNFITLNEFRIKANFKFHVQQAKIILNSFSLNFSARTQQTTWQIVEDKLCSIFQITSTGNS
jgi:hypothetical protein